eukprot:ANDGO_00243.mRNA.1 hypothetical protein
MGKQHAVTHGGCLCISGTTDYDMDNPLIVLVTRRKHRNCYTVPKGHIDPGETGVVAGVRETVEEAGIECSAIYMLGVFHKIETWVSRVDHMMDDWLESNHRHRSVVPLHSVLTGLVTVSEPTLQMCQSYAELDASTKHQIKSAMRSTTA